MNTAPHSSPARETIPWQARTGCHRTARTILNKKNLQPRGGFSWDVSGDGKLAIRGGVGMFTNQLRNNLTPLNQPIFVAVRRRRRTRTCSGRILGSRPCSDHPIGGRRTTTASKRASRGDSSMACSFRPPTWCRSRAIPVTDFSSSSFGRIQSTATGAREFQFGPKFRF